MDESYERGVFDKTKKAFAFAWDDFWKALESSPAHRSVIAEAAALKHAWEDFEPAASGPLEYFELGCEIEIERTTLRTGLEDIAGAALRDKTADELRKIAAKVLEDSTK